MKQRSLRYPSSSLIRLISQAGPQNAHLLDVSQGGCRLVGHFHLSEGEQIALRCCDVPIRGEVRWAGSGRAGIAFQAPLSQDLLAEIAAFVVDPVPETPRFNSANLREMT